MLAKNFRVSAATFKRSPSHNLWIFQGAVPGPLAADRQAAYVDDTSGRVTFALSAMTPDKRSGGTGRIADSGNSPVSRTIAAALVTLPPGGLREMHWHPQRRRMVVLRERRGPHDGVQTGPRAQTADFRPDDVGHVKKSPGHHIENTGSTELRFLEIFRAPRCEEVSLSDWLTHVPPALVAQHLGINPSVVSRFPDDRPDVLPA